MLFDRELCDILFCFGRFALYAAMILLGKVLLGVVSDISASF